MRLKGQNSSYDQAIKKSAANNKHFSNSALGVSKGLTAINGPLNGVTGRFTALSSLATGTAGKIALVGAAFAASGLAVASSVKEFADYEVHQLKTQALLKATGYAAGLSAQELAKNADAVALATLASVSEIQEAQGVLLTFKEVQRETFLEAISLSQDMAAVLGGTAKAAALQLGKALENPTAGLTKLSKSGITFTESEKAMVKQMDATGQRAEAQRFILEKLADQLGGSGSAQAGGLTGSIDTLGQRWDELERKWAASSGSVGTVKGWIDGLAASFKDLADIIEPTVDSLAAKIEELENTVVVGRNKKSVKAGIAGRLAALRQELLLAKAQEGDMDALNQMIERTRDNIESLENSASKPKTGRRRGQAGRKKAAGDPELAAQKQQLTDLIALQTEFNRAKKPDQAAGDGEKTISAAEESKAQAGLAAYMRAMATKQELEAINAETRQEQLDMAHEAELLNEDRWNELTQNNWQAHHQKLTDIQDKESKKRAANEAKAQKAAYSAIATSTDQFLVALEGAGKKKSALYKTMFLAQKAATIPGMIASTEEAATKTLAMDPSGTMSMIVKGMGYASIGVVAGQTIAGVAHGGMGYIPEESTYLLQKGEGVLSPKQNAEVQKMASEFNAGKSSAAPVSVYVIEDASRAGQVQEGTGPDGERMIEAFVANIRQGGPAADVIEQTYQVQRVGR